jgi:taurine--2-oxoglutarate transaminase
VPYGSDPERIMPTIIKMLFEKGFSTYSHENNFIVAPPLIIKEDEIKVAMSILDDVLGWVDSQFIK